MHSLMCSGCGSYHGYAALATAHFYTPGGVSLAEIHRIGAGASADFKDLANSFATLKNYANTLSFPIQIYTYKYPYWQGDSPLYTTTVSSMDDATSKIKMGGYAVYVGGTPKKSQEVSLTQASYSKTYNQVGFNLGATVQIA